MTLKVRHGIMVQWLQMSKHEKAGLKLNALCLSFELNERAIYNIVVWNFLKLYGNNSVF